MKHANSTNNQEILKLKHIVFVSIFAIMLVALLSVLMITAKPHSASAASTANAASAASNQTNVQFNVGISGILFGRLSGEYATTANFDYKWISTADNKTYNKDLATTANMLATDIYKFAYVKGPSGQGAIGSAKTPADYTYLLTDMGFTDVRFMDLGNETWSVDATDVSGLVLAHKLVNMDGKDYDIFVSVVRGTQGAGEWTSDLDVGANTSEYTTLTGNHPDWVNKQHHKGFDVLANRLKAKMDAFVMEKSSPNTEKSMLITGHSRGAAESNILGAMYEKEGQLKTFTYAFSCPLTTLVSQSEAAGYKTIFNFCEKNDLVGHVPLAHWGFTRYGTDIIGDTFSDSAYKSLIEEMMGGTFYDSDKTPVIEALNSIANNPAELYTTRTDKTSMSALDVASSVRVLGVADCYQVASQADGSGQYARTYSDGFFLKGSSKMLEDMMELTETSNSFDMLNRAVQLSKSVKSDADLNSVKASNGVSSVMSNVISDLYALSKLVKGTNCENAFNTFSSANMVEMLMPHLTATTCALTKVAPGSAAATGSAMGKGDPALIAVLAVLGVAVIVGVVIFIKCRKQNK